MDLFEWVFLTTNVWNIVSMDYKPFHAIGGHLEFGWQGMSYCKGNNCTISLSALDKICTWRQGWWRPISRSKKEWERGTWQGTPFGAPDIPYIIPLVGKGSFMPRGALPGPGLDSDRPLSLICSPPHAGNDSGPEGGEPSPPTITQVQHVSNLGGPENPPSHGDVWQGRGTEVLEAGWIRVLRKIDVGLPVLWEDTGCGIFV